MPKTETEWAELPKTRKTEWNYGGSYSEIVWSFGYEILDEAVHGDYQGDYFFLLKDGKDLGFLSVGYGSCSGCDALQACENHEEVENLRRSIHHSIRWMSSEKFGDFVAGFDFEGQYYGHRIESQRMLQKYLKTLPSQFSSTSLALIANVKTPPEIIADSVEEDGFDKTADALRSATLQKSALRRLRQITLNEPITEEY